MRGHSNGLRLGMLTLPVLAILLTFSLNCTYRVRSGTLGPASSQPEEVGAYSCGFDRDVGRSFDL